MQAKKKFKNFFQLHLLKMDFSALDFVFVFLFFGLVDLPEVYI